VPEDRLRKLTQENRDLANSLRHEMLAAQRAARAAPATGKKKMHDSMRGSEERQTSVAATGPRGQKRMRDQDLEKVSAQHSSDNNCFRPLSPHAQQVLTLTHSR
jgi:mortality factor 4-like protein 1